MKSIKWNVRVDFVNMTGKYNAIVVALTWQTGFMLFSWLSPLRFQNEIFMATKFLRMNRFSPAPDTVYISLGTLFKPE
jgi:hypothetical protein